MSKKCWISQGLKELIKQKKSITDNISVLRKELFLLNLKVNDQIKILNDLKDMVEIKKKSVEEITNKQYNQFKKELSTK